MCAGMYYTSFMILNHYILIFLYLGQITIYVLFISVAYVFYFNLNRAAGIGLGTISIHVVSTLIIVSSRPIHFPHYNPGILLLYVLVLIGLISTNVYLVLLRSRETSVNESLIKKTVLDLGTQFTQVEIREISEECKINQSSVIAVVLKMIENKEIYGEYFYSSKSISFNQQANIDEIDNLMAKFNEWEEQQVGKQE